MTLLFWSRTEVITQAREKHSPNFPDQSEGLLPHELRHPLKEKAQMVQVELEPSNDYAIGTNDASPSPEALNNRSVEKTTNLIEGQEHVHKQGIPAQITVPEKKVPIQKFTNKN